MLKRSPEAIDIFPPPFSFLLFVFFSSFQLLFFSHITFLCGETLGPFYTVIEMLVPFQPPLTQKISFRPVTVQTTSPLTLLHPVLALLRTPSSQCVTIFTTPSDLLEIEEGVVSYGQPSETKFRIQPNLTIQANLLPVCFYQSVPTIRLSHGDVQRDTES